jgi:hypothetical protein
MNCYEVIEATWSLRIPGENSKKKTAFEGRDNLRKAAWLRPLSFGSANVMR